MSLNFHLRAIRDIIVVKTGEKETQTQVCSMLWQTPTIVTKAIMLCEEPVKAYCEWVLARGSDVTIDVFGDDDISQEQPPVRQEIVNYSKIHVEEVMAWISIMEKKGYEIVCDSY